MTYGLRVFLFGKGRWKPDYVSYFDGWLSFLPVHPRSVACSLLQSASGDQHSERIFQGEVAFCDRALLSTTQ